MSRQSSRSPENTQLEEGVELMDRGAQVAITASFACWEETLRLSRTNLSRSADAVRKTLACRTPGEFLQVQAEETQQLCDAWVQGAANLRAIVSDAADGVTEERLASGNSDRPL